MPSSKILVPLVALAALSLLGGLGSGLQRLGWNVSHLGPLWMVNHGPLMVCAFLGTLIGVERAVALKKNWGWLAPALTATGGVILLSGSMGPVAPLLMTLGSLALVAQFSSLWIQHRKLPIAVMGMGALAWFSGNLLWMAGTTLFPAGQPAHPALIWLENDTWLLAGWEVSHLVYWWVGFLVLTIAGERLELNKILSPSRVSLVCFCLAIGMLVAGLVGTGLNFDVGVRLVGLAMVVLFVWLVTQDMARRSVRVPGMSRFIGINLFSGYFWLGIGGALGLWHGGTEGGPLYDAILHSTFVGFTFAMIFAHAPVILPALLGTKLPFRGVFYLHWALLQASLTLRITGDLMESLVARRWGGLINVVAILFFALNTILAVLSEEEAS